MFSPDYVFNLCFNFLDKIFSLMPRNCSRWNRISISKKKYADESQFRKHPVYVYWSFYVVYNGYTMVAAESMHVSTSVHVRSHLILNNRQVAKVSYKTRFINTTPLKSAWELICSLRIHSSCSGSGICRDTVKPNEHNLKSCWTPVYVNK